MNCANTQLFFCTKTKKSIEKEKNTGKNEKKIPFYFVIWEIMVIFANDMRR